MLNPDYGWSTKGKSLMAGLITMPYNAVAEMPDV